MNQQLCRNIQSFRIKNKFYQTNIRKISAKFCDSCLICQKIKKFNHKNRAPLVNMPFKKPFQMFAIDITGPLPCTNKRNKYIIVAIDYGSKWF